IASWQRNFLQGAELERQLGYWQRTLAGLPAGLELPTDRPRPAVRDFRGGNVFVDFPTELAAELDRWSRERGGTLFMTLLAGFELVLGRLAGQDDFAVGAPIAGRHREAFEPVIGMFLNNLVLRADLSDEPSFAELVDRVRVTTLDAYGHQDVPFEMLIDRLGIERDLTRTPLFQVFFNMLNLPPSELDLPGVSLEGLRSTDPPAKFDLTVYVKQRGNHLGFHFLYNAQLFDRDRIEHLVASYRHVLEQAMRAPDTPISRLSLLTERALPLLPDPTQALDSAWHGAIHHRFRAHVDATPDAPAVEDTHGTWSYRALGDASARLASRLVDGGLDKEQAVVIWAHRSAALVPAVLGVLEAGGAFLMLDPTYPADRIVEIVRRARPAGLLALRAAGPIPELVRQVLAELDATTIEIAPWHEDGVLTAGEAPAPPSIEVGPEDRALLAFTSGSTGEPKGIEGRHGPLTHFLPFQAERFAMDADDRVSMLSGLAHDPLQRDLFTALGLGGTIVVPDPTQIVQPGYLAQWMAEKRVSVAHLTPAMGQLLAELPDEHELTLP
ncbi:MAG: condensation domain-containing protein, partial [Acidobacteriota bacterium]